MVALFVRLKWTLVSGRIRAGSTGGRAGAIVGVMIGLLISGSIALALTALRGDSDASVPVIAMVFTVQFLAWVLAPLVAFGVDETLDPRRFALLPLTMSTLRRGLLASSIVGYLPVFNVVILAGAAVGLSASWAMLPVAVLCCAAQLAMCVVFSRAASTSLAALLASRRGRDLGMAVGLLLVGGYFAAVMLLNVQAPTADASTVLGALRPLGYGPPGALAVIPVIGAEGIARIVLALVTAGVFLTVGWWWWGKALTRTLTTMPSTTAGHTAAQSGDLGSTVADSLWRTARVVATRDLRLAWRDPARRMPWAVVILFTIAWPFIYQGTGALFAVVLGAVMVGAQTGNHYGVEGSGMWLHLVACGDRMRARGEVTGHALASIIPGLVAVAAGLAIQVTVRGHAELLPAAIGVCLAGLLGSVGAACWMSAAVPFAAPQSRTSVFASSVAGQKGRAAGASFGLLGLALATTLPTVVVAVIASQMGPAWSYLVPPVALIVGVLVLVVAIRAGARKYLAEGPEILAIAALGDRT